MLFCEDLTSSWPSKTGNLQAAIIRICTNAIIVAISLLKSLSSEARRFMSSGGGFLALVAAASVTQIVQFTANVLWGQPSPAPALIASTPPEDVRYCVLPGERESPPCEPVDTAYFGGPYEREIPYNTRGFSLALGACISAPGGLHRCWRATREVPARVNHGRGEELQNQRVGGRGRLSIAPAGALGIVAV